MRFTTPIIIAVAVLGWSTARGAADGAKRPLDAQAAGSFKTLTIFSGGGADGLRLRGADARQQLAVSGTDASGMVRDVTRHVHYTVTPPSVARIDEAGVVTATGDGAAVIKATIDGGASASLPITVEQFGTNLPINFPSRVVPIFTKFGCNAGACHGKASGQNGFRLSLLGFEPTEDYEHLVKEARGRRMFPAAPERSLLLLKATGTMPHGGGKRIDVDSDDYRLITRWIAQGMPYGKPDDPVIASIQVFPDHRVMPRSGEQQIVVTARYSDGSTEDVTRSALFEPNDQEVASVSGAGFVTTNQQPGDVGVMVRYQGKVAVFRATVPLGAPVEKLPPARNFIDELVFKKLKEMGMPPSEVCSDETFLRRVTLDIAGRLPTPDEVRSFVADKDGAKRDKVIDALLDSTDYADFFATKWSALLRNRRANQITPQVTYAFHDWVRDSLLVNKPYDQIVREVLTASGDTSDNPAVAWYRQVKEPGTQLEDTAQLFLGMRLQCAHCHHHPFEKWSQHDYFSFSAFFSRVGRKPGAVQGEEVIYHKRGTASASNPKTKQTLKPAGLGEPPADLSPDDDPRVALADWITRKDNPFFARSLANRYWKHFLGRGIVEPEDDMRETNPPTNPELLDALAKHFTDHNYDLKDFVRTICRSKTYQLDATPNAYNAIDKQNFSRYYPRRLTAEVLLDSVDAVTGTHTRFEGLPLGTRAIQLPDNSFNAASYFLSVFGRPDGTSACECERSQEPSLAQSLHLLNGRDLQDKVVSPEGRAAKLSADEHRSDEDKVRELYLWAYGRQPDTSELSGAIEYINRPPTQPVEKGTEGASKRSRTKHAYEDLMWALINTKEFSFNH